MKCLVLIRHGQTEWSETGRHTGRTDVDLTPAGVRAARRLGRELVVLGVRPVAVLTSPRQRAVRTARLAGLRRNIEVDDDLAEIDYGECEGLTTDEIRGQRPGWDLFRDGCKGGESMEAAGERADRVLASLAPEDGSGDVAVCSHGHFLRILTARYLGLPPAEARHFALGTASVSILGHEHDWRAVLLWNRQPRTVRAARHRPPATLAP